MDISVHKWETEVHRGHWTMAILKFTLGHMWQDWCLLSPTPPFIQSLLLDPGFHSHSLCISHKKGHSVFKDVNFTACFLNIKIMCPKGPFSFQISVSVQKDAIIFKILLASGVLIYNYSITQT
jgi:hypothetical protein